MGVNISFKNSIVMFLDAIESKKVSYISNVKKLLEAGIAHEITHQEREETGQFDLSFGKNLPFVGQEIATHVIEFLYDPWDNVGANHLFKVSCDNFVTSVKTERTINDVYYEARYRSLLIVGHELAKKDLNYRKVFLDDTSKNKLDAIKRIIGDREVLTPAVHAAMLKDLIPRVMGLSQEELFNFSNQIMQDPNNFDMASITTEERKEAATGGIDLTTGRMNVDIGGDNAAAVQPIDIKALENIEINALYIKDLQIRPLENLPQVLGVNG